MRLEYVNLVEKQNYLRIFGLRIRELRKKSKFAGTIHGTEIGV